MLKWTEIRREIEIVGIFDSFHLVRITNFIFYCYEMSFTSDEIKICDIFGNSTLSTNYCVPRLPFYYNNMQGH